MRVEELEIAFARVGDYALFRSGPRRIEKKTWSMLGFIQIRGGKIGGGGDFVPTFADGRRLTHYLPADLVCLEVTHALRLLP